MKQNKTFSLEYNVVDHLKKQDNASQYIEDLIIADIQRIEGIKKNRLAPVDMAQLHTTAEIEAEATLKKENERKERNAAWELLDFEVKEEIKDIENWGERWKTVFYPMYLSSNKTLTLKQVRDWYFANKEGYKE